MSENRTGPTNRLGSVRLCSARPNRNWAVRLISALSADVQSMQTVTAVDTQFQ